MSVKRVLITTTIRVPDVLRQWRQGFDETDVFIVAGDQRAPHSAIRDLLASLPGDNRYLHPDDQTKWLISNAIGWNSVQRRNIALLEAMKLYPKYIITVDDDNAPIDPITHMRMIDGWLLHSDPNFEVVNSVSGWYNVGGMLMPPVVHRGYPVTQRNTTEKHIVTERFTERVGVVASLWLGDPDIDAVQRMCCNPTITDLATDSRVLGTGTWCPFNSQATAYLTELAPLMAVWPHVGRYDDIWGSYLARAVMDQKGWHALYGRPLVNQLRNFHNVITDLHNELLGLEYTEALCAGLRGVELIEGQSVVQGLARCITALGDTAKFPFIPTPTLEFLRAWYNDVRSLT